MSRALISDELLEGIIDDYVDEIALGLIFHFHRAKTLGYFNTLENDDDVGNPIIDEPGFDIFGQPKEVKVIDIDCPECHRQVAATRFAPHLEKCMGMGRNSSRLARRRIANVNDDLFEDEDVSDPWGKAKRSKLKRNGSPFKIQKKVIIPKPQTSSPVLGTDTEGSDRETFEALSPQSKEKFLKTMCGVVSEYTQKLCTRSMKCPQHTDMQRVTARSLLLPLSTASSTIPVEEIEHNSDSSVDTTWLPNGKKKRSKSKIKIKTQLP